MKIHEKKILWIVQPAATSLKCIVDCALCNLLKKKIIIADWTIWKRKKNRIAIM